MVLLLADTVVIYFDPKTLSPITLMELGIVSEGFWRKGNVDILVSRMKRKMQNVLTCDSLSDLIKISNEFLEKNSKKNYEYYGKGRNN